MALTISWKNTSPDTKERFIANLFSNISGRWYPKNIINSTLYDLFDIYGTEFSSGSTELSQVYKDLYIETARTGMVANRDTNKMYDNFGSLLGINKISNQMYNTFDTGSVLNSYRTELKFLTLAYTESTTPDALSRIGQAINGMSPVIIEPIDNYPGWVLTSFSGSVIDTIFNSEASRYSIYVTPPFGRFGSVIPIKGALTSTGSMISLSYSVLGFNTILQDEAFAKAGVLLYFFISTGSAAQTTNIQNIITTAVNSVIPAYIRPEIAYSNSFVYWRPTLSTSSVDIMVSGSNIFATSTHGWIYNAFPTTPTGSIYQTSTVTIPTGSSAFNWFYDWSTIVKNDAVCLVEVRQYNSSSIPDVVPWKQYNTDVPIPYLSLATASVFGHWSFATSHPTSSIYDLSGNRSNLINSKSAIETGILGLSRRSNVVILGGGTTGYNLSSGSGLGKLAPTGSFSWETYIYGIDATNTASYLSFIRTGSSPGQGYSVEFDFVGKYVKFTVGSGSVSSNVTASILNITQESGFPPNYHYFAGSFLQGGGLFLYIDGELVATTSYTGSVQAPNAPFNVRNGQTLFVDEFILYSGFLSENDARYKYKLTKERLRYLGMPSGSYYPYHQARFTVFASGSNEVELHQFSIRGLQHTSASIFDSRVTDLYALPVFSSISGSAGQLIGQY